MNDTILSSVATANRKPGPMAELGRRIVLRRLNGLSEGAMLLQAITIAGQRYETALKETDFIQKHIFPGGFLPSVTALTAAMTRSGDLRTVHLEDIGLHYAETLAHWRANFFRRVDQVRALGFDERFVRTWEFYLCYCEGGFRERDIATVQMLLAKPGWRGEVFGH